MQDDIAKITNSLSKHSKENIKKAQKVKTWDGSILFQAYGFTGQTKRNAAKAGLINAIDSPATLTKLGIAVRRYLLENSNAG